MDGMRPGWPGRGFDPTGHFTHLQWYLFHQRNIVYFAACSARDYDADAGLALTRQLIEMLPHLGEAYRGARPREQPADDVLRRTIAVETVAGFDALPDCWLDDGMRTMSDPDLPFFRLRIGRLASGPDTRGRRSFILVQASHALAEGTDSSRLSRSLPTAHPSPRSGRPIPALTRLAARTFAALAVPMHLLLAPLWTPHPGRIRVETRTYPRELFSRFARTLGVRQRALFMALVAHVICGAGMPERKRRLSTTYSTLAAGGGSGRDPFMRMRMLFASFETGPDFAAFVRSLDQRLSKTEAAEGGFNAEMNAAAVRFHHRLAKLLPFLYSPKVFAFMPYDFVFALIPPHRLGGALTEGFMEPVYAGATMPGINGCVVVPGKTAVTFNFYLEEGSLPQITRLDRLLDGELHRD